MSDNSRVVRPGQPRIMTLKTFNRMLKDGANPVCSQKLCLSTIIEIGQEYTTSAARTRRMC